MTTGGYKPDKEFLPMADLRYGKLQALIVDDFDNFRITLGRMLQEFGVDNVDSASTSAEALRFCASKTYDIILCDQNLGKGKSGQQILEVLRHTPNDNSDSLFVLVSAESNKSIIMAAYDYEPDGYLTKPITAQTLEQRLSRLLAQRVALTPIYKALKESQIDAAIELCRTEINKDGRYTNHCQKILGRLLLDAGRFTEAENLYHEILEVRQLDWAMLGMAYAKKSQGDSLGAQQWLEEIIQFNPLCLKAYDVLADIFRERGDNPAVQKLLQQAVELSPLSILRQQALGDVALKNNDLLGSANAFRKAVKLGENSCHDHKDVHVNFAHATIQLAHVDKTLAKPIIRDALKTVSELTTRFGKTTDNKVSSYLLEAQLHSSAGDDRKSKEAMAAAQKIIDAEEALSLDTRIELAKAMRVQGDKAGSDALIAELLKEYADSEDDLQKIDCLLEEPCSEKNKAMVAKINKDGIAFYEAKNFVRAIEAFSSALQELPQHIGLRLNLVQASLEQLKQDPQNEELLGTTQQTLNYITPIIPAAHAQYRRFKQLEEVWRRNEAEKKRGA
jgi:DNA-binding NarL/FixJ family response regulator/Tfp pilus assembly protein PilF